MVEMRLSPRPAGLLAADCTVEVHSDALSFITTEEVPILEAVIEQDRALRSLDLGLAISRPNYHIYLAGASGTGKRSQLQALLDKLAPTCAVPPDWVYVHNFDDTDAPRAVSLPAGKAQKLKKDLEGLLTLLREDMPKEFHGRNHQERLQRAVYRGNVASTDGFRILRRQAETLGFEISAGNEGDLLTRPLVDGVALDDQAVLALEDEQRATIDAKREELEPLFTDFVQTNRAIERETQLLLEKYTEELAKEVARLPFNRLKRRFHSAGPKLKEFFNALQEDFVEHLERFLPDDDDEGHDSRGPDPFRAFRVKVVVDNSKTKGAPVIFETHPTFYRMFGRIERRVEQGIYFTDHTMIRAGSLMQANGGFLVCHAADLFQLPGVWENLKSTVRNREAAIEDLGETAGLLPTSGLKPEPIPIHLKLILIGSNTLYHMAYQTDDDFRKIFQVKADFDDEIRRSPESIAKYVRFIATAAKNNGCRPLNRQAVSAVIKHGSRLVESQRKLTLRFNDISNVLVEANYHADGEGLEIIEKRHIQTAIEEREKRSSLIADKMHEDVLDDQLLIAHAGGAVGVVNGLAVLSVGEHDFGRPFRVTARCFAGQDGIVNIEREVNMSGEIHDKGVQILAGFLGHRFAHHKPLALTATVTFEQSYGAVDGDSASSTWLYALLSDLAHAEVDQGIGVTGSVNQLGEIQPVGGVNHKVEGFFRFCKARGLDGRQGVLIPWQNVQHLMLSTEVRAAITAGTFHIWPVRSIDEGIALLTGMEAGTADADGHYPPGTLMHAIAEHLEALNAESNDKQCHGHEPAAAPETKVGVTGAVDAKDGAATSADDEAAPANDATPISDATAAGDATPKA